MHLLLVICIIVLSIFLLNNHQAFYTCSEHRTIVADLRAANSFKLEHLEKSENWSKIADADLYYIAVSIEYKAGHSGTIKSI